MSKITINNMTFYYAEYFNPVFDRVNLVLDTDWKLGLVGRNGRGKSTFLRLLTGELAPSGGNISVPVNMEYFPYEPDKKYRITLDVVKESIGGLKTMEDTMDRIISGGDESRYQEYSEIQSRYSELGGYGMEGRILKEMADMGLDESLAYREYASLSGGERTRMMVISLFLRNNSFVLLDEPTNHLDLDGKGMMGEYLRKKKGFIVVSHDRDFLDQVTDHIMSINKATIQVEKGNYTTWRNNMDLIDEYEFKTRDKLEREMRQLERRSLRSRDWAEVGGTQKYQFASNARTNGCQAYMRQAKRSEQQILDDMNQKKTLLLNYETAKELRINQEKGDSEDYLIKAENLRFAYPDSSVIIDDFRLNVRRGDRIWIRGRNGTGKSTLLKLLCGELSGDGDITFRDGIRISVSWQEPLWKEGLIEEKYRTEEKKEEYGSFLELCEIFDMPENFLSRPLETYSSGEQKKIDIARTLAEKNDVIVLDEPLNYMDVYFREQLEKALLEYQPTILFVEHDGRFGRNVSSRIIELR